MITALSAALYFVLVSREFFQFQFRLKMKFIFKVFLALVVRFSVAWYMSQDIQEYLVWKAAFKKNYLIHSWISWPTCKQNLTPHQKLGNILGIYLSVILLFCFIWRWWGEGGVLSSLSQISSLSNRKTIFTCDTKLVL